MIQDELERTEILQEIEALFIMHEMVAQSSECREFNRCAASLLETFEEDGLFRMADSFMDLLVTCDPKDLAQCDSQRRARDILEKLRSSGKTVPSRKRSKS
jgi:hypothetical protein